MNVNHVASKQARKEGRKEGGERWEKEEGVFPPRSGNDICMHCGPYYTTANSIQYLLSLSLSLSNWSPLLVSLRRYSVITVFLCRGMLPRLARKGGSSSSFSKDGGWPNANDNRPVLHLHRPRHVTRDIACFLLRAWSDSNRESWEYAVRSAVRVEASSSWGWLDHSGVRLCRCTI